MPHVQLTEAIVLRKRPLLNKDVFITLFTLKEGKRLAIAKGVKNPTSRRAPHLQTGNLITVALSARGERSYIQQTTLITAFSSIRENSAKIDLLYLFLYIVDRILPESQPEQTIFTLAKKYMADLARIENPDREFITPYLHRILQLLGYADEPASLEDLIRIVEETIHEKIPHRII